MNIRVALQTVTGSTYTSDVIEDVTEADLAEFEALAKQFPAMDNLHLTINGRMKFFNPHHVVWMQAVGA